MIRTPLLIVAGCFLLRVVLAVGTDTYPDEAYYWAWTQHPQLSYFDHPALIAWSATLLGIRTGALLWGGVTLVGVYKLTTGVGGSREQAWWATALFASTPAAALLGTINTPDAPLLAFWVWTLVALKAERPVATGLLWGLAMLSKYNGILLALPVLMVFFRRPLRLLTVTLLALTVTSPTIIWNAMNDWEGFRFQIWHGITWGGGGLLTFLEFVGALFLMSGAVLMLLIAWWLARAPAAPLLKLATLVPLVFFGLASWKARGEANWTAVAWLSASVGVALTPLTRWKHAAVISNSAVLAVATILLVFPPEQLWGVPHVRNLHGWAVLERAAAEKVPVFTGRYQLSALVSFYARVPSTTLGGRRSQYDLWPPPEVPKGGDALWLSESEGPPAALLERFETSTPLDWPLDSKQRALHPLQAFRLVKRR